MNRLFARQRAKAARATGEVDVDVLGQLVSDAYNEADRDRRRTDRSIALMVEELDEVNRGLEQLVSERTATLRDREARLAEQNLLIDAAFNNMSQGLVMFNAEGRLMIHNYRYLELYGLSPDRIKPGTHLKELLEYRVEANIFHGEPTKFAAEITTAMASGQTHSRLFDLPDGRAMFITSRPMAGGGWVVTHEDVTERRRAEKQIAYMAHHDALTGLPNRALLRDRLAEALDNLAQGGRLAVFYLDLDNFKGVNDTLGHPIGDELLKCVAERLTHNVNPDTTVARIGGDEFAIIMPRLSQLGDAKALAHRIRDAIGAPYDLLGHAVLTNSSIGVAIAPDNGTTPDMLLKHADMALYNAKATGRGTFCFFEPKMGSDLEARRALENDLRHAFNDGQFVLHYQPIVNLDDGRILCYEALICWIHPERGLLQAAEFISLAEEIGLTVQLGEWALRQACSDAFTWPDDIKVAINLSSLQVSSPNLPSAVIGALAFSRLPANRLELEIAEAVIVQNTQATLATLHQLRAIGVNISLDGFGAGFSSLGYLSRFPFNRLKIDQSFIDDLPKDVVPAIMHAVSVMAKSLGMETVAGGIESEARLEQMRKLGCSEVQGDYLGPPQAMPRSSG
jgi:diguanylate cyclase (GGDEF)-like protein